MRALTSKPRNVISKAIFKEYQEKHTQGLPVRNPEILLDNLTDLQRNFVIEFLKDLDGTRAVLAAGFKTKYPNRIAWQMMNNEKIKLTIELLQIKRAEKSSVTKDFVLQKIMKIVEKCEADENYNPNAALRGLELVGKHLAMFVERTEVTGKDGDAIRYEKVEEDARDFTSAIAGLVKRNGTEPVPLRVVGGTESQP